MEVRVHLKICEGCGCLWFRAQNQGSVYCCECETKLKDFPEPESRKRRGRPPRKPRLDLLAMAATTAISQLSCPAAVPVRWCFRRENTTLHNNWGAIHQLQSGCVGGAE